MSLLTASAMMWFKGHHSGSSAIMSSTASSATENLQKFSKKSSSVLQASGPGRGYISPIID
jgi:hypothetical protein